MKFTTTNKEESELPKPAITSEDILHEIALTTGWTPRYQIAIICAFIDSIGKKKELSEYLGSLIKQEKQR